MCGYILGPSGFLLTWWALVECCPKSQGNVSAWMSLVVLQKQPSVLAPFLSAAEIKGALALCPVLSWVRWYLCRVSPSAQAQGCGDRKQGAQLEGFPQPPGSGSDHVTSLSFLCD